MPSIAERRKETRRPAAGVVRLRPDGLMSQLTEGRLLDVSPSGFRARHRCQALTAGQLVEFEFRRTNGRARVMWTQIRGKVVESGFYILTDGVR